MIDTIKNGLRKFLNITSNENPVITITQNTDFYASCAKNRIWYGGKPFQLTQLYSQLNDAPNTMFWKSRMTYGREIRKIHIGLPRLMVDAMTNIVMSEYNGVTIDTDNTTSNAERWEEIAAENKFSKTLAKCVSDLGIVGDGAFKISYDASVSLNPIIEWLPAERVKFEYVRGRIKEIKFYTDYSERCRTYQLEEVYGYGYIKYNLYDDNKKPCDLHKISVTSDLVGEGVTFEKTLIWAVPVILGSSSFEGRGKGLIESKEDSFDSVDEAWSQWMDALRACRTQTYVPESLVPRDPDTLMPITPNPFDNRFIAVGDNAAENAENRIVTESPQIQSDAYLSAYITALDMCLQGTVSPSTLGIDVKKLDNAEAQREKEKATLYTRRAYIEVLENALPQLVNAVLNADSIIKTGNVIGDIKVDVNFGEYANPSFESQVEIVGKARQNGVMSVETSVDELYGDSKSDEWKAEEVKRIKQEQGIAELSETSETDDLPFIGF